MQRLGEEPPTGPHAALTSLLNFLAESHKPDVYKPVITCAVSSKELVIVEQLNILNAASKFYPDYWVMDSEVMAMAILSDLGTQSTGKGKGKEGEVQLNWGTARLGQCIIILQLLDNIRNRTQAKKEVTSVGTANCLVYNPLRIATDAERLPGSCSALRH